MKKQPISITLGRENGQFLARDIREGFSLQKEEDLELAMSDFDIYRDLVWKSEL